MEPYTELFTLRALCYNHQLSLSEITNFRCALSNALEAAYNHDDSSLLEDLQVLNDLLNKSFDRHLDCRSSLSDRIDTLTKKDGLL